ncbi:hypothetical protein [Streptomyces sp. NPDC054975]
MKYRTKLVKIVVACVAAVTLATSAQPALADSGWQRGGTVTASTDDSGWQRTGQEPQGADDSGWQRSGPGTRGGDDSGWQ